MKKMTTYQIAFTALFTALMCILGPMSVPIGPVPISLTNFVVMLAVLILGMRFGTISVVVYILLGIVGLPVFSGFTGGVGKIAGPTGGYIIGFIPMALVFGVFIKKFADKKVWIFVGMAVSTIVLYALGTAWFVIQMKTTVLNALTLCVFPFIIGDVIKMVIALFLGGAVKTRLNKMGVVIE